jgi:hypothetical protein
MEVRSCTRCNARWLEGQLYWATGQKASELDLAGLVCNLVNDPNCCINPCKGLEGGDTFAKRMELIGQPVDSEE